MTTPPGFASVTPYMFVEGAGAFLAFLVDGLGGVETDRTIGPGNRIANAQVVIGNCTIMVSEASADWPAMPASYYLYVADADAAVARAIAAGGTLVMPVADMPYQDRQGGVCDAFGNVWWISQRLVEGGYA
ncbi:VOC family protein [Sphingobium algorifonticola]|uniref:VOC family protein n=1 Tax=Sphingobium algorifonticola TaxID=2008318 RepID=A0A437JDK7_9SPHN|nr:VOC family protein [Sphingobium algorifonticola]RVT43770.1 VOC family protein [Sphingobium algorifonticola]